MACSFHGGRALCASRATQYALRVARAQAPHDHVRRAAEESGVFGVPTYILDSEIYWGREHLSPIRTWREEASLRRPGGHELRLQGRVGGQTRRSAHFTVAPSVPRTPATIACPPFRRARPIGEAQQR